MRGVILFTWLALLATFVPPFVLAALPPCTATWRRARQRFWLATLFGSALATGAVFIDPLGPVALLLGMLLLATAALGVAIHAVRIIRSERREWNRWRKRRADVVRETDLAKPWLK